MLLMDGHDDDDSQLRFGCHMVFVDCRLMESCGGQIKRYKGELPKGGIGWLAMFPKGDPRGRTGD